MEQALVREKKTLGMTFPLLCYDGESVPFPRHWHSCFEILLLLKGGTHVSVDDILYEATAGDLVMVNSGVIHGFFDFRPNTSFQGFQFDISFFDESFINLRDTIFQNPVLTRKTAGDAVCEQWQRLLCDIAKEFRAKTIGYQLAIKAKLSELMLLILRESPKGDSKILSRGTKQILSFVFKNADDPELSLEGAAAALKINKFYFSHAFKKYAGQTFHSYLTKTRVNFAKQYLIESKMSVTDIAFSSGFNSLQTFNRVFKAFTGYTPGDYRRKNKILSPTGTDFSPETQYIAKKR
jgi:AraC-like DNA-binding protein